VRREKKAKEIDWGTVVEEYKKEYKLKNAYSHNISFMNQG